MTSSLRAIDRQLLFVRRLLSEDGNDARSRAEAIRLLRDVEESLGAPGDGCTPTHETNGERAAP